VESIGKYKIEIKLIIINIKRMLNIIILRVYNTVNFISKMIGIYIMWIILHYIAAHMYAHLCTHPSLLGFIISPFMVATPHCIALRWIVINGADTINTMWMMIGTWIASKIIVMLQTKTYT